MAGHTEPIYWTTDRANLGITSASFYYMSAGKISYGEELLASYMRSYWPTIWRGVTGLPYEEEV